MGIISKPTDSSLSRDKSNSPRGNDFFKKPDVDYHYTQSPRRPKQAPAPKNSPPMKLKRVKSEKSDSSGSSYHGDFKQSEYSIIKRGFKLDLSERKRNLPVVTVPSRSSSAR